MLYPNSTLCAEQALAQDSEFSFMVRNRASGSCEHSNEPLYSIKGEEFLDQLSDC